MKISNLLMLMTIISLAAACGEDSKKKKTQTPSSEIQLTTQWVEPYALDSLPRTSLASVLPFERCGVLTDFISKYRDTYLADYGLVFRGLGIPQLEGEPCFHRFELVKDEGNRIHGWLTYSYENKLASVSFEQSNVILEAQARMNATFKAWVEANP